jgi:hypothetical protein
MDTAILFQHYELANAGMVKGVLCINDDHGIMHPFINPDTQQGYFECLFCDYKIKPGMMMIDVMREEIHREQQKVWDDAETD